MNADLKDLIKYFFFACVGLVVVYVILTLHLDSRVDAITAIAGIGIFLGVIFMIGIMIIYHKIDEFKKDILSALISTDKSTPEKPVK